MKKSIKALIAMATLAGFSLAASAQPAVKILVVDMAKLYDSHYKTLDYNAKIQADEARAQEELGKLQKELNDLVAEFKSLNEQTNNPTASNDAKAKAQADAQRKYEQVQGKEREGQQFIGQTRQQLQQRLQTFRSVMLEEISKTASEIAKRKGATILLDKAGPSLIGISNLVYADPAYEITEEVSKELNKDRPATSATPAPTTGAPAPTAPATAPAAAPAPATGGGISVPGLPKK